ncbi:MAG: hypothetical protein HXX11_12490 [Desulfuromonadales bacterium]|nr:hypothetical protein [Desulfuromonadales bacterium]
MQRFILCILFFLIAATALAAAENRDLFPVDRDYFLYYPSLLRGEKTSAPFTEPETFSDCHKQQHKYGLTVVPPLPVVDMVVAQLKPALHTP